MSIELLAAIPGASELEASLRRAGVPIDSATGARANLERYRTARSSLMYDALCKRGAENLMAGGAIAKPDDYMPASTAMAVAREALDALEALIPK